MNLGNKIMGNCIHRCFGVVDRRGNVARSRYTDEQDFSIEEHITHFESLIGEESHENETTRLLTDRERQLLSTKQFGVLALEQGNADAEIEAKLAQHEREIEREEATFHEAKREAARIAKLNKDKENISRNNSQAWVNPDEWDTAGDEEDFENFLASVKARSLATRSPTVNETTTRLNVSAQNTENNLSKPPTNDLDWEPDFISAQDDNRL